MTEIYAIAVDPLTENIFYIIPEPGNSLDKLLNTDHDNIDMGDGVLRTREEVAHLVKEKVESTLERLFQYGKPYGPLREENILIYEGKILLENRLLLKQSRGTTCQPKSAEREQNLKDLQIIIESVLKKQSLQ